MACPGLALRLLCCVISGRHRLSHTLGVNQSVGGSTFESKPNVLSIVLTAEQSSFEATGPLVDKLVEKTTPI